MRACGSYPQGRQFESVLSYFLIKIFLICMYGRDCISASSFILGIPTSKTRKAFKSRGLLIFLRPFLLLQYSLLSEELCKHMFLPYQTDYSDSKFFHISPLRLENYVINSGFIINLFEKLKIYINFYKDKFTNSSVLFTIKA